MSAEKEARKQLGREAAELRSKAGASLRQIATLMGIPHGSVGTYERGTMALSNMEAYVSLLRDLGPEGIKKRIAEIDGAGKKVEEAPKTERRPSTTALAREIRAFMHRHHMTKDDVADVVGVSKYTVKGWLYNNSLPHPEKVAEVRAAMARYSGTPASYTPTPKKPVEATAPIPKLVPSLIPDPPPTPAPKAAPASKPVKSPELELVVDGSRNRRVNNGDNIAPHLILDGETMHVFTLVPGGVYISYVTAKSENR